MNEWNELLSHLAELPRENGTPTLEQAGSYLAEAFRTARKAPFARRQIFLKRSVH